MDTNQMFSQFDDALGQTTPTPTNGATKWSDELQSLAHTSTEAPAEDAQGPLEKTGIFNKSADDLVNKAKAAGSFLTQNEQNFGNDIAAGIGGNMYADQIKKANQQMSDSDLAYLKAVQKNLQLAKDKGDQATVNRYTNTIKNFQFTNGTSMADLFPSLNKTNGQVLGDAGGVLLDILASGSYGKAAQGAESGRLLTKAGGAVEGAATKLGIPTTEKVVAPVAEQAAKTGLGQTLKTIGVDTAKQAAGGGALGYGYDVSNNLQQGKTGTDALTPGAGALLGAGAPIVIGGVRAGVAIGKEEAPRFINSLIKPKQADFSYGKNPGRTVSELGITGNSIPDFENNIRTAKNDVGTKLGSIYSSPENANVRINATDDLNKIDTAIQDAAKGGKNNQPIVNQLKNIKDALLYEHGIDGEGNIVKIGNEKIDDTIGRHIASAEQLASDADMKTQFASESGMHDLLNRTKTNIVDGLKGEGQAAAANNIDKLDPKNFSSIEDFAKAAKEVAGARDLTNLNPKEAFDLKKSVAEATQFTGRPSDDKTVNSTLKDIYGGLKEKLNTEVGKNNPEIIKLNQQYGDLTSAELATKNRNAIVQRSAMVGLKTGGAGALGTAGALIAGTAALPATLIGIGAAGLEKAMETTAVKTRIASWLGSESPSAISRVLAQNPAIKQVLLRAFPKYASQIQHGQNQDSSI